MSLRFLLAYLTILAQGTCGVRVNSQHLLSSSSPEDAEAAKTCNDLCIKCPDPAKQAVLVKRTLKGKRRNTDCDVSLVMLAEGAKDMNQKFTSGMFKSGTKLLREQSSTDSDVNASKACDELKIEEASAEQVAACASHSLLCGDVAPKNVVAMLAYNPLALPSDEPKCARLSELAEMPRGFAINDYIVDEDEEDDTASVASMKEEDVEDDYPILEKNISDCLKKTKTGYHSCQESSRCTWWEPETIGNSSEDGKCVSLCDHPKMRDAEVPCSKQSYCRWNAERPNGFTNKDGMCEYLCPGNTPEMDRKPCDSESARASELHALAIKDKEALEGTFNLPHSTYDWYRNLTAEQFKSGHACYDKELMDEQLRFDLERKSAPVARVCDYEHDHSFVHQYLKHDGSKNCHELPPIADPTSVSEEIKQEYLEAGCWPFLRVTSEVRKMLESIVNSVAKVEEQGEDILMRALSHEDLLQRLAKYAFDPAADEVTALGAKVVSFEGTGPDETGNTSHKLLMIANSKLFANIMVFINRRLEEKMPGHESIAPATAKARKKFLASVKDSSEILQPSKMETMFLDIMKASGGTEENMAGVTTAFKLTSTILHSIIDSDSFLVDQTTRRAAQCIPSLWGRIGFAVGGMRNDGNYEDVFNRVSEKSNRFGCSIGSGDAEDMARATPILGAKRAACAEVCVEEAPLSPACSRAAVSQINFWMVKPYDAVKGFAQMKMAKFMGLEACLTRNRASEKSGNCWAFQGCVKTTATEGICRLHPDCCAGDLANWRHLKRGVDMYEFPHTETHVPDTPSTRLVNYCEKFPDSDKC